jgi:hypothetical protein
MSQPDPDPDRYKSRGRKKRTPAQLAVLAQAREKAKIVIAERAKIIALQKTVVSVPLSEEEPHPPLEPVSVTKEAPESVSAPPPPSPPEPVSVSENEDEEPRLTRREVGERPSPKYHYINGMYIKIK